jgi:hypothetical protein
MCASALFTDQRENLLAGRFASKLAKQVIKEFGSMEFGSALNLSKTQLAGRQVGRGQIGNVTLT